MSQPTSKRVFASACFGMLLFGISLITLGSVATALRGKFQLDAITAGTLFSILPIGILAGSLFFGPFSDRYGYKIILVVSGIFIFAGFQGIAWSSSLLILKICIFLFGCGGGAMNGATNAVVADISATNKGANLSLLGVFFAIGALAMPSVLGAMEKTFTFEQIVSTIGFIPLAATVLFISTRYPAPKQVNGIPFSKGARLLHDGVLIAIGFFLFCLSSFEAIINNWTTTYLGEMLPVSGSQALYALSLYVAGMAAMRVLLGSVFRNAPARGILLASFFILLAGCILLRLRISYGVAAAGLVMIGTGLAAGFPVMLGFVGTRYTEVSATAFSVVLTIALVGNMLVNFLMGVIAAHYGIRHLTTVSFVLLAAMLLLAVVILRKIKLKYV